MAIIHPTHKELASTPAKIILALMPRSARCSVLLIEGSYWRGAARLAEILGKLGCRIEALTHWDSFVSRSRYVAQRHRLPRDPAQIPQRVRNLLNSRSYDYVFVMDEPTLIRLASEENLHFPQPVFPVPARKESLQRILFKTEFCQACLQAGISIPQTRTCTNVSELIQHAEEIGYPVILKPDGAFSGNGIQLFTNARELREATHSFPISFSCVLQQFIQGQVGSSSALFHHGRLIAWMASYKEMVHPEPYGPSCLRIIAEHPDLPSIMEKLGQITKFHGFAGADWIKETSSNRIHVLEFNPRATPDLPMARFFGVDLGEAWRRFNLPTPPDLPPLSPTIFPKNKIWMFPQFLIRCYETGRWSDLKLLHPKWNDIPWSDPLLLFSV